MQKPIRLVVLIDFSEYAESLIHLAKEFIWKWRCKAIFMHQVPGLVPMMADSESKREILQVEKNKASVQLKWMVESKYPLFNADYIITDKDLLETIKNLDHTAYQYWVMTGLKGTGLLKKILIGSTTTKLVDETDLPLITVPLSMEITVPKNIICSVSYKYPINEHFMNYMMKNLNESLEQLKLVTIITEEDDEIKAVDYINGLAKSFETYRPEIAILKGKNALDELKNIVEHCPSAYLMLQQGSRNLSDLLFRKFMINELVYHGKIPLIIIPL